MQATPMAGVAADAFAALFAGILPESGDDGRQVAADPGKALPVTQVPPVAAAGVPVLTTPVAPAPAPVVAPVLPVSASEAIAMVPAEPVAQPAARDAVPVAVAAAVVGGLKLLPEDAPVVARQPDPKPEPVIQPMPARFAPPLPVRTRRAADEPALPTPDSDDAEVAEAVEDGDAPILVVPSDAPPIDLPPMVAIPAGALAPVPEDVTPEMKVIGPKVPDAEPTAAPPTPAVAGPVSQGDRQIAADRPAQPDHAVTEPSRPVASDVEGMPVAASPTVARPVRADATRTGAAIAGMPRPDAVVTPPGTPEPTGRRSVAPGLVGNVRRSDQPAKTPTVSTPAPAPRFAPVDRGAMPGAPVVDPVRAAWQVELPADPAAIPAVAPANPQTVLASKPVAVDRVVGDVPFPTTGPVAQAANPVTPVVAQPLPPIAQPQGVQPEKVAQVVAPSVVQAAPVAAPRRAAPTTTARATPVGTPAAQASRAPIAEPAVQAPIAEPTARPAEPARAAVAETVRAPIADAAPRPADPVVIDQPAVAFTLPGERAMATQPVAEPLTPNRQTIAGEASAPVVSVAAPTVQPVKAPPVTRVASAPAPETVAEVVLADAPAPRPRRDDDAPPLPTPAAPAIDAATLRPVSAPVTAQQPHLDTRQPHWVEGMIDRIETLRDASPTQGETRIRLSPDALGDVEVAIRTTEDGRVHVHLSSENADAGRLLADAQPRLLQMAEARGLKLGGMQVDVGTQQQPSQRQAQDQGSSQPRAPRSAFADTQAPSTRTDNRIA
ncbi:flagellar hook-length control protein FliK [Sphingomonas sp. Leaf10]|uniref:flagellar hook-length control protein FliK n=1 Tax=Sphingomonas sp. Leaf10 TaxID=1735676 RepID=UPI000715EB83|nr:flagellar hook-length control protein FliK [Sphingomonas sp. Leaf10]KQM38939.1 hypothetical protein ASE59_10230 [Sphingomonas sp. Leaf10]